MKDYLNTYGTRKNRQMFQQGGPMPAEGGAPPAPGGMPPEGGGDPQAELLALAQAAVQGDEAAATQLGMLIAPMLLEQAGGGAPAPAPAEGGAPVFRKGGKLA